MNHSTSGPIDIAFTASLGKVPEGGTWTCVKLPTRPPSSALAASSKSLAPSTVCRSAARSWRSAMAATSCPSRSSSARPSARPTATPWRSTSPSD